MRQSPGESEDWVWAPSYYVHTTNSSPIDDKRSNLTTDDFLKSEGVGRTRPAQTGSFRLPRIMIRLLKTGRLRLRLELIVVISFIIEGKLHGILRANLSDFLDQGMIAAV